MTGAVEMEANKAKTILIIEDEPDVRLYLQTALEDAGFNILTAEDGEQGMELIRSQKPDLISLDLVLPKKSGPKLFHELKRDKELSRIPVLIVTAHAKNQDVRGDLEKMLESSTLSEPGGGYLEKPVKAQAYVNAVKRSLGMEVSPKSDERIELKDKLSDIMQGASAEELQRALDALKKAK
jgi:CheY-like chemotaxis protein